MSLQRILVAALGVAIVIQVVRPTRDNPPTDQARTLEATGHIPPDALAIVNRACADCHSNRTVWPWYTNVAPVSWLVAHDVHDGRHALNFSDWASYELRKKTDKLDAICEHIRGDEMPPTTYLWMHAAAKLTTADKDLLCGWTDAEGR